MALIYDNPILIEQLNNCSIKIQNFSNIQAELINANSSLGQQVNTMFWIIIIMLALALAVLLYILAKKLWAYRIGIIKNNAVDWIWKWNVEEKVKIGKKENQKTYQITPDAITGHTIMWFYGNAKPIIFDANKYEIGLKDITYQTLNKSTIIEKVITAEDFMNVIRKMIIAGLIIGVIIGIACLLIYKKEMVCNLIIDNKTILTNIIK